MMKVNQKYCVVDAGNTRITIVDFLNEQLINKQSIAIGEVAIWQKLLKIRKNEISLLSSVLDESITDNIKEVLLPNIIMDETSKLPISLSGYNTPHTLGTDRIANAVAANFYAETESALSIDIGTCIKFDLVSDNVYRGGSISPGYKMRLRALHSLTGKLPLLDLENNAPLVGTNTKESILSGVINGIWAEIDSFVMQYQEKYKPLTIFLTGGDVFMVEKQFKSSIFVDENLTFKGLYIILKQNV